MPIPTTSQPHDPSCIFCRIAAGSIPSHKIYEDDKIFVFLDIGPIVTGHTLVIPKAHYADLMETPPELAAAISRHLPALTRAVLAATGTQACHVLVNNGAEASQSVRHLHYHILPRRDGDSYKLPWPAGKLASEAAVTLVSHIQSALKA
ncbi:MAG: HIT domain-containing protein [Phycisphaerae bacterium]